MSKDVKRFLIMILGYIFLLLGVIGAILPIIQGWFFFLIGLMLLSQTTPWAKRWLIKLSKRFPKIAEKTDRWLSKWRK